MPPVVGAFTAISGFTIGGVAVGSIALQLAGSVLLSVAAQRLTRRRTRQQDIKRELAEPQSRPPKRFVYGRTRAMGTPAPFRVRRRVLYTCLILNSRPSAGGDLSFVVDGRPTTIQSGDIYDFSGPGARLNIPGFREFSTGSNNPRVWLGLGDQVGPPDEIVDQMPDDFLPTDGWRGLTVLWCRFDAGSNEHRLDRWPNPLPVVEVEADWSKVWDPRDPAQDPDDPATWQWSNNQALCTLDAVLNNPIRRRPRFMVDIDSFKHAADLADEAVSLYWASVADDRWPHDPLTVPRYTANGTLVWSGGELRDQVMPLAEAGGGDLAQVGGLLTYIPPVSRSPDYTITDILEDGGFEFTRLVPGSDLPAAVKVSYVNPDRGWSEADLPAQAVGAGSAQTMDDGILDIPLIFVTEPTQAMRVQEIQRKRIAAQRRLSCTLPPDAIVLGPGSVADWGIPELSRCNVLWRVESINPAAWLQGEGVALKCPVTLAEEPADVDAWNPEIDEIEIATEDYTPPAPERVPPDDLQATTGPGEAAGDVPRIRFSFEPVIGNVVGYEWQWRETGDDYAEGGQINDSVRDGSDRVFGFLVPVVPGTEYQIRARTLYFGAISDWTDVSITAQGPDFDLDPPSDGQAIGGTGQIEVSFLTPNNTAFEAIEFWGSDTDDSGAATLLATIASAANTVRTLVEIDLGDDVTRYYFARSVGPFGAVSDFSASVSATTDP